MLRSKIQYSASCAVCTMAETFFFLKLVLYIFVLDLQINYFIKNKLKWAFYKKNRINFTSKKEFFNNTFFILPPRVLFFYITTFLNFLTKNLFMSFCTIFSYVILGWYHNDLLMKLPIGPKQVLFSVKNIFIPNYLDIIQK